jgi:hypothetical protein
MAGYNLFQFKDIVRKGDAVLIQATLGTLDVYTFTIQEINLRVLHLRNQGISVEQELHSVEEWKREKEKDDWDLRDPELDRLYE